MLLKSLELQGYKTFAGRTVFEFAGPITAIVGPNGSGKSNIADAIRWVLGEQSYSLLRGKKTEDMIFSGSEQRPRASMAAATILFDNSTGWLPIDFSEVSITRRAYRDGQNEYLINNQRVRLRDIVELLGQSGLSERTYTIIGQGLVDAALALRAEDRRKLFEEAAGIGLYRLRKSEAQRRLETTLRNLERVEDILSEIKPRLRSLERQAAKAKEYRQVREDLHALLKDWYGYHWKRMVQELRKAKETFAQEESRLNQLQEKSLTAEEKLSSLRQQIQRLREDIAAWQNQLSELYAQREGITRELAILNERKRLLTQQIQSAKSDIVRDEATLEELNLRLRDVDEEEVRLRKELEDAQKQGEAARDNLKQLKEKIVMLEREISDMEQQRFGMLNQQAKLTAQLDELTNRKGKAEQDIIQYKMDKDKLAVELEKVRGMIKTLQEEAQTYETKLSNVQKRLETIREKISSQRRELNQKTQDINKLEQEISSVETRLNLIEQAENDLLGYSEGAKKVLNYAAQQGAIGDAKLLGGAVLVDEAYEAAVAAALGEFLDAVILDVDKLPEDLISYVKGQQSRGVIVPLGELSIPSDKFIPEKHRAILGLAIDFVDCDPKIYPVMQLLLGHVVVVEDLKVARNVLSILPQYAKVVTLDGDVLYPGGIVVAGGNAEKTKLSRPREQRRLRELLGGLKERKTALLQQVQSLESTLMAAQNEQDELINTHEELHALKQAKEKEIDEQVLQEEKATRQSQWLSEQVNRLSDEINSVENEIRVAQEKLDDINRKLEIFDQKLVSIKSKRDDVDLDDVQREVTYWNTQIQMMEQALARLATLRQERERAVSRVEELIKSRQQMIESYADQLDEIAARERELSQNEEELNDQAMEIQTRIEPAERELAELERQNAEILAQETEMRKVLAHAERQYAQAQLNLNRKEEALSNLREKIEDDFGLVEYIYDDGVGGPIPLPFEGFVERLPVVEKLPEGIDQQIKRLRAQLRRMGAVNPEAEKEYLEVRQRYEFMTSQIEDLKAAEADIHQVIDELDELMRAAFEKTFHAVAEEFKEIFKRLFGGGSARLVLTDPDNLIESGIEIEARLPGRRTQGLSLLSGGERSLTATALVFALLRVSPTPFCILDEVDAMLDEANVGRFRELLKELSENTQFIVITHNRNTVQVADVIYGVTMGADSSSRIVSLKMDEVAEVTG